VNITALDISSSDIRRRMRGGKSIKYLLPEDVESFIISNKLYSPVT
jgi:nicotinate-nucleotide adenylyltransferase